jgi:hypothetical protein
VLVVSNLDLAKNVQAVSPAKFLESQNKGFTLNLDNDYRYLKSSYYVSMHAEILGNPVIPTSRNIIDASRTPILLLKAHKAGIPTLPNLTTGSVKQILQETTFPIVLFPVNPFMYNGYKTANNRSALYRAVKSLGLNYKFTVCVQPLIGEMTSFKSIFGKNNQNEPLRRISERVFEVFKIPVCKLHVQRTEKEAYLCGLQPLRREEILPEDLEAIRVGISEMSRTVTMVG